MSHSFPAQVLVRKHDEAPSETLVSLIIPPAALPSFRSLDAASPSPAKAEARAGKLHAGGSGLEGVAFSPDGDVPCGTWSPAPGATFKIRQLGYAKSKREAPSVESFYEVVAVDLAGFNLQGALPTELGDLTMLGSGTEGILDLGAVYTNGDFNSLSGTLPTQLGRMTKLNLRLNFNYNQLVGSLPTELGKLSKIGAYSGGS